MPKRKLVSEATANQIIGGMLVAALLWLYLGIMFPDGPPKVQHLSLPMGRMGKCPAPVGYHGTYFLDRSLIEWRGEVLRALPGSAKSDGRCFLINNCSIPGIEVVSKNKGVLTIELVYLYGGPSSRIYYPSVIIVE